MAYIINKTNGEQLLILEDGTLNNETSLGLLGKNTIGYGEVQNENFVRLLENFAGSAPPSGRILTGQVYFNTSTNQLNVYDGTVWNVVGDAIVSDTQPSGTVQGNLWLKTPTQQLFIYNNGWKLIGPEVAPGFGVTRAIATVLEDTQGVNHAVVQLVVNDSVIAICSSTFFTIASSNAVAGFTAIRPGITISSTADITGNLNGNSLTATKLQNKRKINGVDFDGSADIEVTASNPATLTPGNYITGNAYNGSADSVWSINASSVAAPSTVVVRDSQSNFSANTITANLIGNVTGNVNTIEGTSQFNDVVANRIEGNLTGNVVGNSTTASRLESERKINGVGFNGSKDISITAPSPNALVPGSFINGQAYDGSGTISWAVAAESANQPGTVVARDPQGNFSANTVTATSFVGTLTGNVNTVSGVSNFNNIVATQVSANVIGNLTGTASAAVKLTVPRSINNVAFDGSQNITIKASTTKTLNVGQHIIGSTFDGSNETTWSVEATQANQANKIVLRDGNGNFSASNITSNLTGNVTGNVTGNLNGTTTGTHNGPVNGNVVGNVSGTLTGNVVGNVSGTASGNVAKAGDSMSGRLTLSAGANGGLAFPTDAYGGSGDSATITLETKSGEATTLTIRVTNDADDTIGFFAPSNNGLTMNNNVVWHAGNDGAGSGLDADTLDGLQPSTGGNNNIVQRDSNGNFSAGTITANLSGTASGNVAKTGDSMSGYLTLVGSPVNTNHAATKGYVDNVAGANAYRITYGFNYSSTGYTNQVGSWNDSRNYFDVYPPAGYSMGNLVAFIPSIAIIHYAGGVNGDDSMRCYPVYYGDRVRVYVQNTEQRSTPAANWLAIWR